MNRLMRDYLYWSGKATERTIDRFYRLGPVTIRVVRLGCGCWRITLERKIRHPGFDP
ncbi:MAG: hypothetical protein ABIJ57_01785 [Pseudomonadota bacterium]